MQAGIKFFVQIIISAIFEFGGVFKILVKEQKLMDFTKIKKYLILMLLLVILLNISSIVSCFETSM